MTYTVKDHGTWVPYTPDPMPEWAAQAVGLGGVVVFLKRESDGLDFYEFRNSNPFAAGAIVAATQKNATGDETVGAVFRDVTMMFPAGQRLIEIGGVDPAETKPHNLFGWLTYHPDTLTFSGEPVAPQPPPVEVSVTAAQALIQLSRMPHDGSVVPGAYNLLDATEALVAQSGDRELKTWFARAQRWILSNPNVAKIGAAFGLSATDIRAAFDAAALIEE